MVPMNLLPRDASADYIVTGAWSQKAVKEAKKVGGVNIACDGEAENFNTVPAQGELKLDPGAAYVASRRTRRSTASSSGTCPTPATCRSCATPRRTCSAARSTCRSTASSMPAPRRTSGRPGVALVIVKDEWLKKRVDDPKLPTMLNYAIHAENTSMYNTPPVLRHLHHGPRDEVAARRLAASTASTRSTSARRRSSTPRSIAPASTGATPQKDVPVADERHLPPAERGARGEVREGSEGGRASTGSRATGRSAACARRSTTRSPRKASTRSCRSCRSSRRRTGRDGFPTCVRRRGPDRENGL